MYWNYFQNILLKNTRKTNKNYTIHKIDEKRTWSLCRNRYAMLSSKENNFHRKIYERTLLPLFLFYHIYINSYAHSLLSPVRLCVCWVGGWVRHDKKYAWLHDAFRDERGGNAEKSGGGAVCGASNKQASSNLFHLAGARKKLLLLDIWDRK